MSFKINKLNFRAALFPFGRKWKLEKGNWLGGAWMAPLHKRQRQPRKRSFVKAGIRGQKLVPLLHRVRSNQETREQRPRAALPFSPRCVTLKRAPRRSPNLFFQRPLHHNPRFFTESIDKRFCPSGSADQLRVHDSRNNQGVLAPSIVQRLSGRYMQRIARVPQSHDDICVERRGHSSSCPRSSRSHFCMAFRPFPIPGLPIPIYFAKGLSFRTAFTYFFAPAIDNPPYPEYLAHLCNGKVKNHRIPKRSQKAALKRGLAQGPKFR